MHAVEVSGGTIERMDSLLDVTLHFAACVSPVRTTIDDHELKRVVLANHGLESSLES